MESILLAQFKNLYDSYARDNQAGFEKGRGCNEPYGKKLKRSQNKRRDMEKTKRRRQKNMEIHSMIFIKFKADFDSVKREAIWNILECRVSN